MKKGNIITILVVVFVVLLGVLYIENNRKKSALIFQPADNNYDFDINNNEIPFDLDNPLYDPTIEQENINRKVHNVLVHSIEKRIVLPKIPKTPYTTELCQTFIDAYSCQEGIVTSEGLVDCNPQYSRTSERCQQFIDGIADEYGEYIPE